MEAVEAVEAVGVVVVVVVAVMVVGVVWIPPVSALGLLRAGPVVVTGAEAVVDAVEVEVVGTLANRVVPRAAPWTRALMLAVVGLASMELGVRRGVGVGVGVGLRVDVGVGHGWRGLVAAKQLGLGLGLGLGARELPVSSPLPCLLQS